MNYKITSEILSKALGNISELENLDEIKKISIMIKKELLEEDKTFFKELNEILGYLNNLEELNIYINNGMIKGLNLNSINSSKLKKINLQGIDLRDVDFEKFSKDNPNIEDIRFHACIFLDTDYKSLDNWIMKNYMRLLKPEDSFQKEEEKERYIYLDRNDENYLTKIKQYDGRKNITLVLTSSEAKLLIGQIPKNINVQILIKDASELSVDDLEKLEQEYSIKNIKIDDPEQVLSREQKVPYNIEEYKRCRKVIDEILDKVDLTEDLYDKNREKRIFGQVIYYLAQHIRNYDVENIEKENNLHKLIVEEEKRIEKLTGLNILNIPLDFKEKYDKLYKKYREIGIKPRNMVGGLLNNTCVCAGFAEIVRNIFVCSGIEVRFVGGKTIFRFKSGHAWNQIKLDGVWYNMDLTYDLHRLLNNELPLYLLKSDKDFMPKHKGKFNLTNHKELHKCHISIPNNELMQLIYGEQEKEDKSDDYYPYYDYFELNDGVSPEIIEAYQLGNNDYDDYERE